MNTLASLPPRKDPIRAGRIFMLASELTLNDLRADPTNANRLWAQTAQLLTNALECLLLAREEQTRALASCKVNAAWSGEDQRLSQAIELLADILSAFKTAGLHEVEELTPPLAALVAELMRVESN